MINGVTVTVIGNVGGDPDLKFTPSGRAVATFSVASTPRRLNRESGKWEDGTATWYRCNAWGELGEHITETITKGARVIVVGELEARDWTNGDKSGTSWEINVQACGPDLTWATAKVSRATKGAGRDVPPPDDPWATRPAGAAAQSRPQGAAPEPPSGWGAGYSDEPPF